jgi:hypothetical protein
VNNLSKVIYNVNTLCALYKKVVEEPNQHSLKEAGTIKCPECDEEILIVPTLHAMSEAIENHVRQHKQKITSDPILAHKTSIVVRLALMG